MHKLSFKRAKCLSRICESRFSTNEEEKSSHIFISKSQMVEKAKETSRIPLRKEISLFTDEYFKIKGDHMNFKNVALEPKLNANMVTGLGDKHIEINNVIYKTPVVVTSNMIFVWEVDSVDNLAPDHFVMLEYLLPDFKYAVIGLGENRIELNNGVKNYLNSFEKKIDNVDWFLASSAFNNCMENDVEAVGFFFV